jgi:tetratricopeptide (TPR) repeat protein
LERSLDLRRRVYGPNSPLVGTTQFSLGAAREEVGDLEGARRSYEDAIRIGETSVRDDERLVYPLLGLARIDLVEGDTTRSISRLNRAIFIRERAFGTRHPDLAEVLVPLAVVSTSLGDTARARSLLSRAWRLQTEALDPRSPAVAVTLEALAGYHQRIGARGLALEEALQAEEIGREQLRHVTLGLPGAPSPGLRRRSYIRHGSRRLHPERRRHPAARERVYSALVRSRALVLDEVAHRLRLAARSSDPHIVEKTRAWNEARQRVATLAAGGPGTDGNSLEYRAGLEQARREADEAERALMAADRRSASTNVSLEQISRAIPPETALLSYVRTDVGYGAFVLSRGDSAPTFFSLGRSAEIDSSVERWMTTIWKGIGRASPSLERTCRDSGARVRALVFDPIRPALQHATRILVVPDGSLHQVNFYALPAGSGYMVESGIIIHELACERDVLPDPRKTLPRGGALIVGGPDFDHVPMPATSRLAVAREDGSRRMGATTRSAGRSPCADLASLRFHPLPGALREAEEVARMWRAHAQASANPPHGIERYRTSLQDGCTPSGTPSHGDARVLSR